MKNERHSISTFSFTKHWSRIDAFSLQQLEKQIKDHKDILKRHSYEETTTVGKVGKF